MSGLKTENEIMDIIEKKIENVVDEKIR